MRQIINKQIWKIFGYSLLQMANFKCLLNIWVDLFGTEDNFNDPRNP